VSTDVCKWGKNFRLDISTTNPHDCKCDPTARLLTTAFYYNYIGLWHEWNVTGETECRLRNSVFLDITPCSPSKVNWCFGGKNRLHVQCQNRVCCLFHAGFMFGLFFDSEDGGVIILWKVRWLSKNYMVLYFRRQNCSCKTNIYFSLLEPQLDKCRPQSHPKKSALTSMNLGASKISFFQHYTTRNTCSVSSWAWSLYLSPSFAVDSKNSAEQVSLGKWFLGLFVMWEKP
jgi:hypothetical protein